MTENFGALISEIEKLENSVLANNLKELENTLAGINDNNFRFVNGLELLTDLIIDKNINEDNGVASTFNDEESKIENFACIDNLLNRNYSDFTREKNKLGICKSFSRVQKDIDYISCNFNIRSFGYAVEQLAVSDYIFDDSSFNDAVENINAFLCISVKNLPYDESEIDLNECDKDSLLDLVFGEQNLEFTIPEDKITDEIKAQFEKYKDFFANVADRVEKHLDTLDDIIHKNKNNFNSFSDDDIDAVLEIMGFNNTIKKLIRERRAIHNQNTSREIKRIMNYILDQIVE